LDVDTEDVITPLRHPPVARAHRYAPLRRMRLSPRACSTAGGNDHHVL